MSPDLGVAPGGTCPRVPLTAQGVLQGGCERTVGRRSTPRGERGILGCTEGVGAHRKSPRGVPKGALRKMGHPKATLCPEKQKKRVQGHLERLSEGLGAPPKRPRRGPWGEKAAGRCSAKKMGGKRRGRRGGGGSERLSGCTGAGLGWNTGKWRWGFRPPGPGGSRIHGVDTG